MIFCNHLNSHGPLFSVCGLSNFLLGVLISCILHHVSSFSCKGYPLDHFSMLHQLLWFQVLCSVEKNSLCQNKSWFFTCQVMMIYLEILKAYRRKMRSSAIFFPPNVKDPMIESRQNQNGIFPFLMLARKFSVLRYKFFEPFLMLHSMRWLNHCNNH